MFNLTFTQRTHRYQTLLLILGLMTLFLSLATPSGRAGNVEKLDALCMQILESLQSYQPVEATRMGIHSYDHRLTDYSSKSVKNMVKALNKYESKLHKYKKVSLPVTSRINYRLAKSNVDMLLLELDKIKWHKKSPQIYAREALDGVYYLMLSEHAPLSERLYSILARMKAVPDLFQTARKNIKKPSPAFVEMASRTLESGIDFYRHVSSELMNKFPDRADEILATSTRAREAMNDFLVFLSETPRGDEKAFAIGATNYDYIMSNKHFLDYSSDSLLKLGEAWLGETRTEYIDYVNYFEEDHQNGQDSVFVPSSFGAADVMDYYNWEMGQVRLFLDENDLITVPTDMTDLKIEPTPSYFRTIIGSQTYLPAGPFDREPRGILFVRPIPSDLDRRQLDARFRYANRRGFRRTVVREGYPGRHLQFQLTAGNENPVRKWQQNSMFTEGWALYCDELMYHRGLYGDVDHTQWLLLLEQKRLHAARLVADIKLHTGHFTFDECVDWMSQALAVESESGRQFVADEILRMTHAPTELVAPLLGKVEIDQLYEIMSSRDGEDFNEREFHDTLMTQGAIPPALMWEIFELSK